MPEYFREIKLFAEQHLDPRASALAFAGEVRRRIDGLVSSGQAPKRYRTFVDGREGAPFENVRPGGTIAAEFSYVPDVVLFALSFLRARSPSSAGSGGGRGGTAFRDSFWIAVDGKYIGPGPLNPGHLPEAGPVELIIGNTQPYNRKVSAQTVGNRALRFSVPPFLYNDAAKAINQRFGNTVVAKAVRDIDFPGKYRLKREQRRGGAQSHRVKRHAGAFVESPALVSSPRT